MITLTNNPDSPNSPDSPDSLNFLSIRTPKATEYPKYFLKIGVSKNDATLPVLIAK